MRNNSLKEAVKTRRKQLGITQGELAALAGTAERSIYEIESGRGNPRWETLLKITDVLGLEISFKIKQ